jgi:transposase-like protein
MASRKPSLIVVPQQPASYPPDPEVVPKASRRTISAAEKLRILNEVDACTQPGQIGALLRREGLYASHLVKWRRLRAAGQLQALAPLPRGPKRTRQTRWPRNWSSCATKMPAYRPAWPRLSWLSMSKKKLGRQS